MKSRTIVIHNDGNGFADANKETLLAAEGVLDAKETRQLCLITEEMLSLLRSVSGDMNAEFWLENEGKDYTLHLQSTQTLGNTQRNDLIHSSSTGTNDAAKGFLGKLREMFEAAMSVGADVDRYYGEAGAASQAADITDAVMSEPKWDKLERSVLLSLADDVRIGIKRHLVELTVIKNFAG